MTYTEISFEDFGYREIELAADLLHKYVNTANDAEYPIRLGFNHDSANVFLIDEYDNVFMINGDKLEQFHSCGECGREGFKDEFEHDKDSITCASCKEIAEQ